MTGSFVRRALAALLLTACGASGGAAPTVVVPQPATPAVPTAPGGATSSVPTTIPVTGVRAQGHVLVDASGRPIRLRGVNRSGTEYACIQGRGIFDGPSDDAALRAIAAWKANVVRVPLNESCWLNVDGVRPAYGGAAYQQAIAAYVARIRRTGMAVILELHWLGPGTTSQTAQPPMPNRARSPEFWRQVATAYRDDAGVVFDLLNEPFPDGNRDTPEAWRCWRDGGTCAGMTVPAAGMQELVTAVRSTGATNLILLGGVKYANSLTGWLTHRVTDPLNNVAASWHVYNFNACNTLACWNDTAAPVAQAVPLILGELGDDTSRSAFVSSLMDWMDARGGSYLPWVWNVWGSPLDLITAYDGTPTAYGRIFQSRFGA
jgi:hypothetical protein